MEDTAMVRINRIKSDLRKKETFLNTSGNDNTPFCSPKQNKGVTPYTSRSGDPSRK